jgi:DNA-binding NarL/FixJ family response regulator
MKMRSDASRVIQNVTSATAELLSTRERNIINLIARGGSSKEIARNSPATVKSQMKRMMVRPMFIRRKITTIRLQVITLLNRWLSPDPPPFYGWPDDKK